MFVISLMLFQQSSSFLSCSLLFFQMELNYPPCFFSLSYHSPLQSHKITLFQICKLLHTNCLSFGLPISPIAHHSFKTNTEKIEVCFHFLIASTSFSSIIFILVREEEKLEKGDWMEGCVGNVNDALLSQMLQHKENVSMFWSDLSLNLQPVIAAGNCSWTGMILSEPVCSLFSCTCLCLRIPASVLTWL